MFERVQIFTSTCWLGNLCLTCQLFMFELLSKRPEDKHFLPQLKHCCRRSQRREREWSHYGAEEVTSIEFQDWVPALGFRTYTAH